MIMVRTTTTSTDWSEQTLDIDSERVFEFNQCFNTPKQQELLQQGITEGWIVVIGE